MASRTRFPPVFWVANSIEVLERFSYYGIYMGFGIYMEYLGYTKAELGIVQGIFLLFSYVIPVISGTFADRFGFKKVLIVSYLAYLPSVLLRLITRSVSGHIDNEVRGARIIEIDDANQRAVIGSGHGKIEIISVVGTIRIHG